MTYRMSLDVAAKSMMKIFGDMAEADTVSLEEIYAAAGRDLADEVRNRQWFSNKLVWLRRHGFVTAVYAYLGYGQLTGVRLTEAGRVAALGGDCWVLRSKVGRIDTLEGLAAAVLEVRKAHPAFDIELRFELKKEKGPGRS